MKDDLIAFCRWCSDPTNFERLSPQLFKSLEYAVAKDHSCVQGVLHACNVADMPSQCFNLKQPRKRRRVSSESDSVSESEEDDFVINFKPNEFYWIWTYDEASDTNEKSVFRLDKICGMEADITWCYKADQVETATNGLIRKATLHCGVNEWYISTHREQCFQLKYDEVHHASDVAVVGVFDVSLTTTWNFSGAHDSSDTMMEQLLYKGNATSGNVAALLRQIKGSKTCLLENTVRHSGTCTLCMCNKPITKTVTLGKRVLHLGSECARTLRAVHDYYHGKEDNDVLAQLFKSPGSA